jgi:ribosomal protein L6P/L9E
MPLISQIVMYLEVEVTIPLGVCVVCFKKIIICCVGIKKQRVCQSVITIRTCKLSESVQRQMYNNVHYRNQNDYKEVKYC